MDFTEVFRAWLYVRVINVAAETPKSEQDVWYQHEDKVAKTTDEVAFTDVDLLSEAYRQSLVDARHRDQDEFYLAKHVMGHAVMLYVRGSIKDKFAIAAINDVLRAFLIVM